MVFAELSVDNLLDSINQRRKPALGRFIFGLGIPQVGQVTSFDIANQCQSINGFRRIEINDLCAISGVGQVVAQSIIDWLATDSNQQLLDDFARFGVLPLPAEPQVSQGLGSFVITGRLDGFSRDQAREFISQSGGRVVQSISSKTTGLIVGQAGSLAKLKKAEKLGVMIIPEVSFLDFFSQ